MEVDFSNSTYPPPAIAAAQRYIRTFTEVAMHAVIAHHNECIANGTHSPEYLHCPYFVLEFAATQQIHDWENRGLGRCLRPDLPSYFVARAKLCRWKTGKVAEMKEGAIELVKQVMKFILDRMYWYDDEDAEAIVIGEFDEEISMTALADLLWKHRHT